MNDKQLPTLQPGDSHMESLIDAAIQGHASTRDAMRWLVRQLVPATQPADVTDEQINAAYLAWCKTNGTPESFARAILALRHVQAGHLNGCNCRWDGGTQVEWCELHSAHRAAIHEWAERAKTAEAKLRAMRHVQVPMTDGYGDDEHGWAFAIGRELEAQEKRLMSLLAKAFGSRHPAIDDMAHLILTRPAHHGITAQAKKEQA